MPRVVVIKQETDVETLRSTLLSARVSDAQAASAMEDFRTLNPHVAELTSLKPGTIVLVPDSPRFKASASASVAADPTDDLQKLVSASISAAAHRVTAANAARAEERAELANAQKLSAVKKAAENDPQLREQLADAAKASKAAQQENAQAEKALDLMLDGAHNELTALSKLMG
jgi:hypothetical protein